MRPARILDTLWRWSPLATLPVALLFLQWAYSCWHHYRAFALEYDARPIEVKLYDVGLDEWNDLSRRTAQALSGRTLSDVPEALALNSVQLFVNGDNLAELDSDLPYSGYEPVKGQLMFKDGLHEVKVRYRGDFLVHWAYDKKSIRVKTGTDELFEGMRAFNLIVPKFPEQVNNFLGYRLARTLGLISPRCELVNVSINGRNTGLYEFTEQLEEGTLRSWDRMPGDLYSGDLISKTAWLGSTNRVFELPAQWEKIAANNHFDLESRAPLERLLRLLNDVPNEANEAELSHLLDMDAFGAFGAFELLTQTHHFDEFHNWRLFWDPWALKFQPVVWDSIAWAPDMRASDGAVQQDVVVSRLHVWLHRNGDFLAARHAKLRDFFASGKQEQFTKLVDWALAAATAASACDPNTRPTDPLRVADGMARFRAFYEKVLRDVRTTYLDTPGRTSCTRPDADGTMAFEVDGRQPVDEVVLRFRNPVTKTVGAALRTYRGDEHTVFALDRGVVVQGNTIRVPARMFAQLAPRFVYLPNQILRQQALVCTPTYYELQLTDLPAGNALEDVATVRAGVLHRAEIVAAIQKRDQHWLYRPSPALPTAQPQVWSGERVISGTHDISDEVVIEPGTLVRMDPGAVVIFRNRVTAIGTPDQPIRIVPTHDGQEPWGTFSINGPACSGSTFRNCKMRGGSGYKTPVEEYSAMFSIHNCRDVRVEYCRFADNAIVDDQVHAMYSEVTFDHVELINALADALDCDISEITVRNSRFVESGNDGVDLMTTKALVHDCQFLRNGDKGISIGESTSLVCVRNTFDGCVKAMEAKDGSIARAVNCEIRNCERALNAYRKNWRYDDGGDLEVYKSTFAGNKEMPTADPHSRILLLDCQVDKGIPARYVFGKATVRNRATMLFSSAGAGVASPRSVPFPEILRALEPLAGPVWATARGDVRGGARVD